MLIVDSHKIDGESDNRKKRAPLPRRWPGDIGTTIELSHLSSEHTVLDSDHCD